MEAVLASRNRGKLAEMQALFGAAGLTLRLVSEFSDVAAEESAPTFVENALAKARHAARASGLPAIADDSGLEVDALNGRPGVISARYAALGASPGDIPVSTGRRDAGVHGDDAANNARVLRELAGLPEDRRGARFVCVMAFLRHAEDPVPLIAQGAWRGRILEAPRGANGFGYDPLFFVPTHGCASAELPAEVKNRISHRALAAAGLLAQLTR
jgi:XTP/dITP diphosphohydrolase